MIKLVIFDKDGTLINHDKLFIPWFNELLKKLEPLLSEENNLSEKLGFIDGKFTYDSVIPCGTNKDIKNMIKDYTNINDNILNQIWNSTKFDYKNIDTHGDLNKIFSKIKEKGIKIAICTSDDRIPTTEMININGISKYIDYYVCGDDGGKTKPSGDPIRKICDYLNILPEESIMVGDTISDIKAGKDARCSKVISVLTGGYSKEELQGADIIIPNISHIFEYL